MIFEQTPTKEPALHNKDIHSKVASIIKKYPPGFVLDLPSGPGYLLKELKRSGFSGIAGEIDKDLHVFKDIEYNQIDMSGKFPFKDKSFDYIVSIEGIEHIENRFSFIREVSRTLKANGVFIMTTPNVHSMESRLNFFLAGFHSLCHKPIPVNCDNIYFEHINPVSLESIYFMCARSGLNIQELTTAKYRKGSLFLYYLLYPLLYTATYIACFCKEKDKKLKQANKDLFKFLVSKQNLAGGQTIILARKNGYEPK